MNTRDFRGALIDNAVWPVDIAIKRNLIETRARDFYSYDEVPEIDDEVEYIIAQFRLIKQHDGN